MVALPSELLALKVVSHNLALTEQRSTGNCLRSGSTEVLQLETYIKGHLKAGRRGRDEQLASLTTVCGS